MVRELTGIATRQLDLPLPPPRTKAAHGGPRRGAGRPRKTDAERTFIPHGPRPVHRKSEPVHVTVRVLKGVPSLRAQVVAGVVKRALIAQRAKLTEANATHFQVVQFTIQDDHVHLLVEANDKRGLARGMAGLEVRIARRVNKLLGRKGRFWKERYHRRDLRTPTETRNALRYVLMNFRKHRRLIGSSAVADPKSSATSFDGFAVPVANVEGPPYWLPVEPRTWLLRTGWRRHGLIHPDEAPRS